MTAMRQPQLATPPDGSLTDALWARYRETGDVDARAQLLDRYLGLVHHTAREIGGRTPAVELDDLVSAGTLGLIRALETFDLSRGLAFSTYAVQRIRGAILDDLLARDWTPRSVRVKGRQIAAAVSTLEKKLARSPEPKEIAEVLNIDVETYWQWRGAVDSGVVLSFEGDATYRDDGALASLEQTLEDPNAPLPGTALAQDEESTLLREAIAELPEKERLVLSLYYYEELNLRQIAEVLHVTESRISQIRTQTLRRLREKLSAERYAV
jgi:RNA polymerase sigma factor for flagellar operon FliA